MPQSNPWIVFLRHGYTPNGSRTKTADFPYWISFMSQKGYRKNDAKYGCLNGKTSRSNVKAMSNENRRSFLSRCHNSPKGFPNFMRRASPRSRPSTPARGRSRVSTPSSYPTPAQSPRSRPFTPGGSRASTPGRGWSRASTPGPYRALTPPGMLRAYTPGRSRSLTPEQVPEQVPEQPVQARKPKRKGRRYWPDIPRERSSRIKRIERQKRQTRARLV